MLADQVCVLFQLIGGLQQLVCQCFTNKCCQRYEFYRRKGYRKSNAIRITAIVSSMLWRPHPLFSSNAYNELALSSSFIQQSVEVATAPLYSYKSLVYFLENYWLVLHQAKCHNYIGQVLTQALSLIFSFPSVYQSFPFI